MVSQPFADLVLPPSSVRQILCRMVDVVDHKDRQYNRSFEDVEVPFMIRQVSIHP